MKQLLIILVFFVFSSCIPLRIAPKIKEDKVMIAQKFKKQLPRDYALIFEDPKDANEFYNYINTKYGLNHKNVQGNVPFTIDNEKLFFSFYEVEISTKTINLVPIAVDVALASKGYDPMLENLRVSRVGNWYLVLTVSDSDMNDCLEPNHKSREKILKYLRDLREEYLNTHHYIQTLLRK